MLQFSTGSGLTANSGPITNRLGNQLTNEKIRIMYQGKVVRWKLSEDLQTTLQFSTGSGLTANSGPITKRLGNQFTNEMLRILYLFEDFGQRCSSSQGQGYCKQWTNHEQITSHLTSAHSTNEMLRFWKLFNLEVFCRFAYYRILYSSPFRK